MMNNCKNCEYWLEKYRKCEHPFQLQMYSDDYGCPPDYNCDLWESNGEQMDDKILRIDGYIEVPDDMELDEFNDVFLEWLAEKEWVFGCFMRVYQDQSPMQRKLQEIQQPPPQHFKQ